MTLTLFSQPVGVLFLHVAKLMVLGRMLQFVSRAKSSRLSLVRRSQRAFVTAVSLVDLVRAPAVLKAHLILTARPVYFVHDIA